MLRLTNEQLEEIRTEIRLARVDASKGEKRQDQVIKRLVALEERLVPNSRQ